MQREGRFHSGGLLMEAGCQLGLKSHFVLTVDDVVVQLVPACGCSDEEEVFQLLCSTMRYYVRSVVATGVPICYV